MKMAADILKPNQRLIEIPTQSGLPVLARFSYQQHRDVAVVRFNGLYADAPSLCESLMTAHSGWLASEVNSAWYFRRDDFKDSQDGPLFDESLALKYAFHAEVSGSRSGGHLRAVRSGPRRCVQVVGFFESQDPMVAPLASFSQAKHFDDYTLADLAQLVRAVQSDIKMRLGPDVTVILHDELEDLALIDTLSPYSLGPTDLGYTDQDIEAARSDFMRVIDLKDLKHLYNAIELHLDWNTLMETRPTHAGQLLADVALMGDHAELRETVLVDFTEHHVDSHRLLMGTDSNLPVYLPSELANVAWVVDNHPKALMGLFDHPAYVDGFDTAYHAAHQRYLSEAGSEYTATPSDLARAWKDQVTSLDDLELPLEQDQSKRHSLLRMFEQDLEQNR